MRANRLKNGENIIRINETSFLPSLEMLNREQNKVVASVLSLEDGIDIKELETFVEIVLILELRDQKFTDLERLYTGAVTGTIFQV